MELSGAVVVVTGASSGIGEATAALFAASGAHVVLAARRLERLEELAARIGARGGEAIAVRCDVTSQEEVDSLVATVRERFGRVDVLVNNAGIPGGGPFRELSMERVLQVVDVNLLGVLRTTKAFLPMMLERRAGHVVDVASVAGRFASPASSVYGATKHAVVAFGESLAYELSPLGILVTTVNPGLTRTEGFPMTGVPRALVMPPERIAETIVDVVRSDRGPEVTIPRWVAPLQLFRILIPPLYRWGMRQIAGPVARRTIRRPR